MRKVVITGVGSLVLSGLLVTQSLAGLVKSDLVCNPPRPGVGKVTITAKGDVKGFIKLTAPLGAPLTLTCVIECGVTPVTAPVACVNAAVGDTTLHIKAPGLGASLGGPCFGPTVGVG